MVQILPPKTDLGTAIGTALGSGLNQGIQQGTNVGFQRGLLQNALKGLENLPQNSTPYQLASALMQATAGIPGSERYVGQLFPLLLGQLRSQQAFGQESQQPENFSKQFSQQPQGNAPTPTSQPGGILGSVIPQDQINAQAQQYAQSTGTGLEGATQMQNFLKGKNETALQQRALAEQKAADLGVPQDEIPLFMQIGQKHQNAKTFDNWVRDTNRDFKEYKNLSKSLESATYPGFVRGLIAGPSVREGRLKQLDNTVKRLVDLGFEQEVRQKLTTSGLSPTEVEERIHPFSPQTKMELQKLPSPRPNILSSQSASKNDEKLSEFLQKNVTPDTSLLALRQRLWQDKGYDWQKISAIMNQALDPNKLTTAQVNELGILEREPPRQSLSYIFNDWGNFLRTTKGEK